MTGVELRAAATPPHDLEAEQAVLGAVLLSDAALAVLLEHAVEPEHFYRPGHGRIYRAMLAVHDRGAHVDRLTLADQLRQTGELDDIGGLAAIDVLHAATPNVSNVAGHCQVVRRVYRDRALLRASYELQDAIHAGDELGRDRALAELADLSATHTPAGRRDQAAEFVSWYENDRTGIPLPFGELTEAVGMGGLQAGETTMLGGWPMHGKTIVATQTMLGATLLGARCHEYANEMTGPARTARLLATLTGVPFHRISGRKLNAGEVDKVHQALQHLPFHSTPAAGWAVEDYCRDLRRNKWDLAAIDTVTNLPCSRVDEWDRACGMLNDAAEQAGTHLILLCQLNLERDKGAIRPKPTGRDLRNTGAWYQRSRVVMFVHREQELVDGTDLPRVLPDGHIRVDKASHGVPDVGLVRVTLNPRSLQFDRLDDYRMPAEEVAA